MKKILLTLFLAPAFFANAQNVGIGTSNPSARLHVIDSNVLFSATGDIPVTQGVPPLQGAGRRMMWYPDKAAFRVGQVIGGQWDQNNIGSYSFASGTNTIASGNYSIALGSNTTSSGNNSTALGYATIASAEYSTAMGSQTTASETFSTTMGFGTNASGTSSTAMGFMTSASAESSTAMGYITTASGYASTSMGENTIASGGLSTAMGSLTTALGDYSTAMGYRTDASGDYSTAMGYLTTASGSNSTTLGYATISSAEYSTAMGSQTTASETFSTAMGFGTTASGTSSTSMGFITNASAESSTAMGYVTTASGYASTSMGENTIASGGISTAMGSQTTAKSAYETVLGRWNTDYTPLNINGWGATDRLFVIGNGTGPASASSDALTVLKNGNVGIGETNPGFPLNLSSSDGDKISLDGNTGDHFGFGIQPQLFQIHTQKESDDIVFGWGNSNEFNESMRISGNGDVLMQGRLTQLSDMRLKKEISPLQNSLEKIIQLNGYHYYWKDEELDTSLQSGVIAQEVQKIFPELIRSDDKGYLSVNYIGLIPYLIQSIKEQQVQNNQQQDKINQLSKENEDLRKIKIEVEELKKMIMSK